QNPREYLYNVVNPLLSLQEAMRSALREVVGSTTLDEILTTGREKAREQAFDSLVKILNRYQTGFEVVNVNLQDVRPPAQVIEAFDDVNKAREDKDRYINEAGAYEQKVTSEVKGHVQQILQKARADKEQMVAHANAGVASFVKLLPEYQRAPTVTRERMYLETLESILSKSSKVMLDTHGSNNMMYIPLDKLINMQNGKSLLKKAELSMDNSGEGQSNIQARSTSMRQATTGRTYEARRGYQ
ncbi:MAG: FtsH protease activity modulator HflK, partial [Coxiellaceae bacterium]|nr:FtsH protease activity modulator HflK [Coxiellaceae bacterium]